MSEYSIEYLSVDRSEFVEGGGWTDRYNHEYMSKDIGLNVCTSGESRCDTILLVVREALDVVKDRLEYFYSDGGSGNIEVYKDSMFVQGASNQHIYVQAGWNNRPNSDEDAILDCIFTIEERHFFDKDDLLRAGFNVEE